MADAVVARRRRRDLGRVPLSAGEIESLSRQDEAARRRERLLQVREQEKRAAQLVTQRYRDNLRKLQSYRLAQDQREHARRQDVMLSALHEKYQLSLQGMGAAQRNAREKVMELVELAQIERRKWAFNRRGEKERFEDAVDVVQEDAAERLARRREIERNLLRLKEVSAKQRSDASARAKRELETRIRLQKAQEEAKQFHLRHADSQEFSQARKTRKDVTAYQLTRTHCVALPGPGALKVNTTNAYKEVKIIRHNRAQPRTVSALAQAEAYREQMERRREEEWRLREENLRVADSRGQEALHVVESIRGGERALDWLAAIERVERVESTPRPGGGIHKFDGVRAATLDDGSAAFARQFGIDGDSDIVHSADGDREPVSTPQRITARREHSLDESGDSEDFIDLGVEWPRPAVGDDAKSSDLSESSLGFAADRAIEQRIETMNELLQRIANYRDDAADNVIKTGRQPREDDQEVLDRKRYEQWKRAQEVKHHQRDDNPASDSSEDEVSQPKLDFNEAASDSTSMSTRIVQPTPLQNRDDPRSNDSLDHGLVSGNVHEPIGESGSRRQLGEQQSNSSFYSSYNSSPQAIKQLPRKDNIIQDDGASKIPRGVPPISQRSLRASEHASSSDRSQNSISRSLEELEEQLQKAIERTTSVYAGSDKLAGGARSSSRAREVDVVHQRNSDYRLDSFDVGDESNEMIRGEEGSDKSRSVQQYQLDHRRDGNELYTSSRTSRPPSSPSSASHSSQSELGHHVRHDSLRQSPQPVGDSHSSLSNSDSLLRGLTVVHPATTVEEEDTTPEVEAPGLPKTVDNTSLPAAAVIPAASGDGRNSTGTASHWITRANSSRSSSSHSPHRAPVNARTFEYSPCDEVSVPSGQSSHRSSSFGQEGEEISEKERSRGSNSGSNDGLSVPSAQSSHRKPSLGQGEVVSLNDANHDPGIVPLPAVVEVGLSAGKKPKSQEAGEAQLHFNEQHQVDSSHLENSFSSFHQYSLPLSDSFSSMNDSIQEHDNAMANELIPVFPRSHRHPNSMGSEIDVSSTAPDLRVMGGDTSVLLKGLDDQNAEQSSRSLERENDESSHLLDQHDGPEEPGSGVSRQAHYAQRRLDDYSFSSDSSSDVSAYAFIERMQKMTGVSASARARLTRNQEAHSSLSSSNNSLSDLRNSITSANARNEEPVMTGISPDRRRSIDSSSSSTPSIDARFRYLVNMTEVAGRSLPLHLNVSGEENLRHGSRPSPAQHSLDLSTSESEVVNSENPSPLKASRAISPRDEDSPRRSDDSGPGRIFPDRVDLSVPPAPLFQSRGSSVVSASQSERSSEEEDKSLVHQPYQQFSLEDLSKRLAAVLPPLPFTSMDMSQPPAPLAWSDKEDESDEEQKTSERPTDQEVPSNEDPDAGPMLPLNEAEEQSEPSATHQRKGVALFVPLDPAGQLPTGTELGVGSLAEAFSSRHPGIRSRAESTRALLEQRREQLAERRAAAAKDDGLARLRELTNSRHTAKPAKRSVSPTRSHAATASASPATMPMPKPELLNRLASGERAKISREEMHERTRRLYNQLPEVAERKRQEDVLERRRQRLTELREREKARREQQRRRRDDAP